MKKTIFMAIAAILITGLLVTPSMAKGKKFTEGEKGPSGQAGKSNIGHLYLYEKIRPENPEGVWEIVKGGPWGKMKYNLSGPTFDFVFNGHGLPIGVTFELIYYPDPWPVEGLICLGYGTVRCDCDEPCDCSEGSVHIQGSYETEGDLPTIDDANYPDGAKIWLVPKDSVDCENQVMNWWPGDDAILFEGELIKYKDTDKITE